MGFKTSIKIFQPLQPVIPPDNNTVESLTPEVQSESSNVLLTDTAASDLASKVPGKKEIIIIPVINISSMINQR